MCKKNEAIQLLNYFELSPIYQDGTRRNSPSARLRLALMQLGAFQPELGLSHLHNSAASRHFCAEEQLDIKHPYGE